MSRFKNWNPPKFYKKIGNLYETKYGWAVSYPQGLGLGKNVDVGYGTYIQARYGVYIGVDAQIGGGCHIYSYNSINNVRGEIIIGENAKIGAHCILLPGTIIEPDELIPANSIVYFDTKKRERIIK